MPSTSNFSFFFIFLNSSPILNLKDTLLLGQFVFKFFEVLYPKPISAFHSPCEIINRTNIRLVDYCLPVWGHLPKASADRMDHCLVRMLRYILHDSSACFTNTTYTSLGLRNFHHAVAVRCSSCLFTAMRQNKLGEIVLLDSNAVPTSLTQKRSDGAHKFTLAYRNDVAMFSAFNRQPLPSGINFRIMLLWSAVDTP